MYRSGINKRGQSKLLYLSQSLEQSRVDNILLMRLPMNEPMYWVTDFESQGHFRRLTYPPILGKRKAKVKRDLLPLIPQVTLHRKSLF